MRSGYAHCLLNASYSFHTSARLVRNLREFHLQAYVKSHLSESERGSGRFNTSMSMRIYTKHHQLRSHTSECHAPPGTEPYICTHPRCIKSFATNQKLRGHLKSFCLPSSSTEPAYPPSCMHPSCNGRTFTSQHDLRAHQKLHELEALLSGIETPGRTDYPRKRKRGGEMKALTAHNNGIHLGHIKHICPHQRCSSAFGCKHLLAMHMVKIPSAQPVTGASESEGDTTSGIDCTNNERADSARPLSIDRITGHAHSSRSHMPTSKTIHLLLSPPYIPFSGSADRCAHILFRVYDLRRRLKADHGLLGDKRKVDCWVKAHRGLS
ncbi:hypothetical protein K503DRAFT_829507 [Rhizopogon vinicolor AM-OR11-026]|uniref:C2H2-type domain-containing protein n=1 Tax=Rhizopogon vinicolor AM-OR11-026 TaxID=1314800 RepID=A0A1B7MRV3_9AGAM|nr:hypothetical protein K503DRAFT_829507 [Rhizopogon vinicolor AM-OR11-026]